MAPINALQPTFSGGEFAPSLYSRVDIAKYTTGLKTARNFFIHPHGGASNRQGTEFIAATKYTAKKSRLIPFEFSTEQAYVLEFAERSIRVFKDGSLLTLENSPASFDPTATYTEGSYVSVGYFMMARNVSTQAAIFFHTTQTDYPFRAEDSGIALSFTTDGTTVIKARYVGGANALDITLSTNLADNTAAAIQAAVRAIGVVNFIDFSKFTVTENAVYGADRSKIIGCTFAYSNTRLRSYRANTAVTGSATNTSIFPGSTWAAIPPTEWVQTDVFEIVTPYTEADLPEIKVAQSADVLYITHPNYAPRMLVRYGVDDWHLELYNFKNGPFMVSNTSEGSTLTSNTTTSGYNLDYAAQSVSSYMYAVRFSEQGAAVGKFNTGDKVKISGAVNANLTFLNGNVYSLYKISSGIFELRFEDTTTPVTCAVAGGYIGQATVSSQVVTTITASLPTFAEGHVGALFEMRHDIEGQKATSAFTATASGTAILCGNTWRITTRGTWAGSIQVEKSTDGGTSWTVVRGFSSSSDFNVNTYGEVAEPCLVRVRCTAYASGTINVDLTTDAYEHVGIVKITGVTSSTSATGTILKNLGATTATSNWAEGSWSTYRGWPSTVTFYQDRLCLAGTVSEPQTIWMSQTGIYDDFGRSSPLLDTDGITINLPSRKMNGIKNLLSFGDILALTASTEWSIGPGNSGVITPTSVTTKLEGYRGSATVDPVIVGNRALYFQPMGAILRDMGYSFEANGYSGDDLTIIANHLFDQHSIVEMAYQQEPDSLLWCIREDGKLLSLTYLREQEVVAWTWHETEGTFESVCSIPGDGYNEVWFVVNRTIGGVATRFIERFVQRMASTAPADQVFMDCAKTYSGPPATTIAGLGHLEGKTVAVLADGNVVTGKTVTGGAITLTNAASKVHVGLPYTCDLETLNVELNLNSGTTQGTQVKISEVTLRFLNSRGGQVGPDSDNGGANLDDIITRTSEPLGSPTNLYTGDIKMPIVSGYDVGGRIFFRQDKPLPTTILAVIPVVTVGG